MVRFWNPKNVFWEAFLLALAIFLIGMFLGIAYENSQVDKLDDYYAKSEIFLMDLLALNDLAESNLSDCSTLVNASLSFADRIYNEARILQKAENAGKIKEDFWIIHQKYDMLRTFLWIISNKIYERCDENFSIIIYLYKYNQKDLVKKAKQNVWSKILFDLKIKKGEKIILIPIAADSDSETLNSLTSKFNIKEYPVIIINNEKIVSNLSSIDELEKYLN